MKLTGDHTLKAERKIIWDMLMDPVQLAKITPGVSELEKLDESNFKAISEVKIGPVKGKFTGDLSLEDLNEPESFTLKIQQKSKIGNVSATIQINLADLGSADTQVNFKGDAKLSGLLARTGTRVVSGVTNSLTKQFFNALEKELEIFNGQNI